MNTALPRAAGILATLGLLVVLSLSLPAPASATHDRRCFGEVTAGKEPIEGEENPLLYRFHCQERIVGFTLISSREISAFDPEIEVNDAGGNVVASDSFTCEGDFPTIAINCFGIYGADNRQIQGYLGMTEKVCTEPRPDVSLVVVMNSVDKVNGHRPAATSRGEMAGPFPLGRPRGCPPSSQLAGLLALVEEVRAMLRSAAGRRAKNKSG